MKQYVIYDPSKKQYLKPETKIAHCEGPRDIELAYFYQDSDSAFHSLQRCIKAMTKLGDEKRSQIEKYRGVGDISFFENSLNIINTFIDRMSKCQIREVEVTYTVGKEINQNF